VLRHTFKPEDLSALAGSVKFEYPIKIKQLIIKQVAIKLVISQEKDVGIRK
jgi:hypothetical protein